MENKIKEHFLKTGNTKHLLAILRKINNKNGIYNNFNDRYVKAVEISIFTKGGIQHDLVLTKEELKLELSNREHIKNSVESRRLRQKLAKKYRKGFKGKKDK